MEGGSVFAGWPPDHAGSVDVTGAVFKRHAATALISPLPRHGCRFASMTAIREAAQGLKMSAEAHGSHGLPDNTINP